MSGPAGADIGGRNDFAAIFEEADVGCVTFELNEGERADERAVRADAAACRGFG